MHMSRFSLLPVCRNKVHRMRTTVELLLNLRNAYFLFGMRKMLLDSLMWILFHTPLDSKRHLYSGLLDAILWMHVWSYVGERVDRGLTMTLRGLLSHSPDQSNTVTLASPGIREIYEKTATDSLKSSGEITTVFTSPRETCAKSSSCTSLRTGPLRAMCECILCVWTGALARHAEAVRSS